jgi:hypothetical protein
MCFGLAWFEQVLIWIIVVCAIVALLKLLVGFVLPKLGLAGEVVAFLVAAFRIVIWAIICIVLVIFIFDLIACLLPSLGGFPRLR